MENLPHDDDGNALRRLRDDGSDLSLPMCIDFAVAIPNRASGLGVATVAQDLGFETDLVQDEVTKRWTCYCKKCLIPTYVQIIEIQRLLDEISHPYGGKSDGWGSFGNKA